MHTCTHMHTYPHKHKHTCIRAYTHAHTYIAYKHTNTHTCIHAYTHTRIHAYTQYVHTRICACTHAYVHTRVHTCMHTYKHTHMHTHTHRHIHIYIKQTQGKREAGSKPRKKTRSRKPVRHQSNWKKAPRQQSSAMRKEGSRKTESFWRKRSRSKSRTTTTKKLLQFRESHGGLVVSILGLHCRGEKNKKQNHWFAFLSKSWSILNKVNEKNF